MIFAKLAFSRLSLFLILLATLILMLTVGSACVAWEAFRSGGILNVLAGFFWTFVLILTAHATWLGLLFLQAFFA